MKKHCKWVVAAVMMTVFMAMYLTAYRHVLIFHEQHHLFRFSWTYISELGHQKGALTVAAAFMAQFAYYPWLGALLWSLLLTGVYLMQQSIIRRLTGLRDLMQLSAVLPIWMFFRTVDIDKTVEPAIMAFAIVTALWLLALIAGRFIPRRKPSGKEWRLTRWAPVYGPLIFGALFAAFYLYSFREIDVTMPNGKVRHFTREEVKRQKDNEKLMIQSIQALRRGDWERVVELTDRQAETKTRNHLMSYFRGIALYNTNQLLDRLFAQPQYFGSNTLFFPWKADKNRAEYGGYIYEQLGMLNSAIHWEFEAMVGWGETAHHLINLSRYLIETGKDTQARKFIAPLKQTLFYRSTARELEGYLAAGDVPGLRDALKDAPQTPLRSDNVLNLAGDCIYVLQHDPDNEMARQYLMTTLLLGNNLGDFYRGLNELYTPGEKLPRLYEEALCLVRLNYGSERLAADGFTISPEVDADFRAFLAEKQKDKFARYTPAQQANYWFYASFLNPNGPTLNF